MKHILLLISLIHFIGFGQISTDEELVRKAVISWADSTFFQYDEPRFEQFVPHYTDEFLMVSMRLESIERSINRMNNTKERGTYRGTDEEFGKHMAELESRKKEAISNNHNFRPKVTHYSIVFWANIKLDSGVQNYVKHELELNDDYRVVKATITGNIGDNSKGKIIYR